MMPRSYTAFMWQLTQGWGRDRMTRVRSERQFGRLWTGGQFGRLDTGERNKAVTDSMKDVTKIATVSYRTVSRALTSSRIDIDNTAQIQCIIAGVGRSPRTAGHSLAIPRPCASGVTLIT